jgi:hypothetical protein
MGPIEIFAANLTQHRGSSEHSTTRARNPLPLFQSGPQLIFKTQGSASLHPGLRSSTPSAFSPGVTS